MTNQVKTAEPELSETFKDICVAAFRFALDHDGAPARCDDRRCRRFGRCHLAKAEHGPGPCGGGLTGSVAEQAGLMLAFLAQLASGQGDRLE